MNTQMLRKGKKKEEKRKKETKQCNTTQHTIKQNTWDNETVIILAKSGKKIFAT